MLTFHGWEEGFDQRGGDNVLRSAPGDNHTDDSHVTGHQTSYPEHDSSLCTLGRGYFVIGERTLNQLRIQSDIYVD